MMQFKNYFLIFPRLNSIYLTFNKFKNNSHSTAISFHLNQFCLQFRSTALDCFTFFHIQVAYQPWAAHTPPENPPDSQVPFRTHRAIHAVSVDTLSGFFISACREIYYMFKGGPTQRTFWPCSCDSLSCLEPSPAVIICPYPQPHRLVAWLARADKKLKRKYLC